MVVEAMGRTIDQSACNATLLGKSDMDQDYGVRQGTQLPIAITREEREIFHRFRIRANGLRNPRVSGKLTLEHSSCDTCCGFPSWC